MRSWQIRNVLSQATAPIPPTPTRPTSETMPTTPVLPPDTRVIPQSPDWGRLIGVPQTPPFGAALPSLAGRRILITGAAGSIGSALAKTVARAAASHRPASLILLDTSEHGLYQIDRELAPAAPLSILGSVADQSLLTELFTVHRPQLIFHAAALKHVPLMERNPFAAVATNALGTYTLAQTALAHRAEHLILVSTDKAVAPHSLMGASKRIAELVLLALATPATRMTAVRLGNVLGSHGSVVPLFLDQIAHGGPITVTHPEARRYLIPIGLAIAALLAALEAPPLLPGAIFIPDLGTSIRILDLARHLIARQATTTPIEIHFTGLRPGDKLEESLLSPKESWLQDSWPLEPDQPGPTTHLRPITSPAPALVELQTALAAVAYSVHHRNLPRLLETILQLVPEYSPSALLANEVAAQLHPQVHA
jgi:FlaA1/EpsC-like NDP-sugar epimerase